MAKQKPTGPDGPVPGPDLVLRLAALLRPGPDIARAVAQRTMDEVNRVMGFLPAAM